MQRNIADFESRARKLVEGVSPDLGTVPPDVAAKMLNDRLSDAKDAETRSAVAARRLGEAVRNRAMADTALGEALGVLATLVAELPPGLKPADFLAHVHERDRLLLSLTERRMQLIAQSDGHSEESLRSDLATFDADRAEAALKSLTEEDEKLDQEAREVFAEHDRAVRDRAAWEQGIGAEVAVQQRRNAEAELAAASREWAVLKLGALLMETSSNATELVSKIRWYPEQLPFSKL
ncbi:MAG: hypothetical protein IPP47_06890 [Bryobacterales bacterium]|nr:hypothetical protein [Bryobacterales bacterium]